MTTKATVVNVTLDGEVLAAIDKVAAENGMKRSAYINWYFGALLGVKLPPEPPKPIKSPSRKGKDAAT